MPTTMSLTPEQRIAQLESELAAHRAEMQDFAYTVSHDLRAPLRHITAYAQLLQEEAAPLLNDETRGFIDTITQAARTLGAQLDALRAYAQLAGTPLHLERVDLKVLVADSIRDMALLPGESSSAAVQWNIAPDLPAVWADAQLLRQALMHVLGNAVFFSQRSPAPLVSISGSADATGAGMTLLIEDNGMGCDLRHTDKLFSVFARMHNPQQLQGLASRFDKPAGFVAGLGMGLASTRRIVQRLGGSVTLQSAPGAGCAVRLQLPLLPLGPA